MFGPLKRSVSRWMRVIRHRREGIADGEEYLAASTALGYRPGHEGAQRASEITRFAHTLEKSLSMPDFRPRSGTDVVRCLAKILDDPTLLAEIGDPWQIETARAVLQAYRDRHEQQGVDVSDLFASDVPADESVGGVREWLSVSESDRDAFTRIVESRRSVRSFDTRRIPERQRIEEAIRLAIRSPSVCNRQTWRVHAYSGETIGRLLALQSGNRGFGQTIPLLLVVTSDMRSFTGSEERYQPWIEGGLFSMTLLLGLHAHGLGAVPLNWSVVNATDRKFHRVAKIPAHERIAMLVGCGHPTDDVVVPVSRRRPVDSILRWHQEKH